MTARVVYKKYKKDHALFLPKPFQDSHCPRDKFQDPLQDIQGPLCLSSCLFLKLLPLHIQQSMTWCFPEISTSHAIICTCLGPLSAMSPLVHLANSCLSDNQRLFHNNFPDLNSEQSQANLSIPQGLTDSFIAHVTLDCHCHISVFHHHQLY